MSSTIEGGVSAFAIHGRVVGVHTPTGTVAKDVSRLLPSYSVDASTSTFTATHALESTDDGWVVVDSTGSRSPCLTRNAAFDVLEHLVVCDLLKAIPQYVHLHASGAVTPQGAVVALGGSGAGKSTLALAWSLSGRPVFGDDITLVDVDAKVHPFRRLFAVHRDRLAEYDASPSPGLTELTDADEGWFDPARAGGWADPAVVARVAIVRYESGVPLTVRPLSRPELLAALSASTMPTGRRASAGFDRLVAISRSSEAVAVHFGDAREAAEVLATIG